MIIQLRLYSFSILNIISITIGIVPTLTFIEHFIFSLKLRR